MQKPVVREKTPGHDPNEMSFLEHLEVLRKHLIRGLIAIGICSLVAFAFVEAILQKVVLAPLKTTFITNQVLCRWYSALCIQTKKVVLQASAPAEQFIKAIVLAIATGFIVAFPYVCWELWRFVKPGLYPHEIRRIKGSVFVVSLLFFLGVAFGYFVLVPFTLSFFSNFQLAPEIQNLWRIGQVIGWVLQLSIACGLLFQWPLLSMTLAQLGVLSPQWLKKYRKHFIVVIFIIAGIVTPSPDVLSQLVLALPMLLLYEISVWLVKKAYKKRRS